MSSYEIIPVIIRRSAGSWKASVAGARGSRREGRTVDEAVRRAWSAMASRYTLPNPSEVVEQYELPRKAALLLRAALRHYKKGDHFKAAQAARDLAFSLDIRGRDVARMMQISVDELRSMIEEMEDAESVATAEKALAEARGKRLIPFQEHLARCART